MTFDINALFLIGVGYLLLLFGIAYAAERQLLPEWLSRNPLVYVLSLGVYASSFAIYGAVGFAQHYGYAFLNYYIGISAAMVLLPVLLAPLHRICKTYRLNSLADLLSFRFRSQLAGSLVTMFMAASVLPLLAIQIRTVADSTELLGNQGDLFLDLFSVREVGAFTFCVLITIFTILFGSRSLTHKDSHQGLVVSMAFESLVKLLAMLMLGAAAVWSIFGGLSEMQDWLINHPSALTDLNTKTQANAQRLILVMFFAAAVCMPHLFHMLFTENSRSGNLTTASWALPLFLLLMSLPILPILWAGQAAGLSVPTDYFTLGIPLHLENPQLVIAAYLGGVSAGSGVIIVATLALASMSLNHLVLPVYRPPGQEVDIYRWLLWTRQLLIAAIILVAYLFYNLLPSQESLTELLMISLSGGSQFLPAIVAILYWPSANRTGFISGLCVGFGIWAVGLLLPMLAGVEGVFTRYFNVFELPPEQHWITVATLSLVCNALVFLLVSSFTETPAEERSAAEACTLDDLNRPSRQSLNLHDARQMKLRLQQILGESAANQEFDRALEELNLRESETRPYALRRIRDRIEVNLSALIGPSSARRVIDRTLPYTENLMGESEDINYIEERLEQYQSHLTGLAADLDSLRRYHRETLENLPIGVCALGQDQEILLWNMSMSEITHVRGGDITGSHLSGLPHSWATLLKAFFVSEDLHWSKRSLETEAGMRWLNLHKTESGIMGRDEKIVVVEDVTENQLLENELAHQERLASIGRLAAGVAHEIGNPVTGIASLAQNLRYDTDNPESLETASQIIKQTQRITSIVRSLVNFAHTGREDPTQAIEAVNIRHSVSEAMQLLQLDSAAHQIHYNNDCADEVWVMGDAQRLLQVFVNLLSNARDASPLDGMITVTAAESTDSQMAHITIADRGHGIDDALKERIFEPFFTTKEPGKGTGLGLALVYSIIRDLGGEITIESPVADQGNIGTRIHIHMPLATPVSPASLPG